MWANRSHLARRSARKTMTIPVPVMMAMEVEGQRIRCRSSVIDVSMLGSRLSSTALVRPGQIVELSPTRVPGFAVPSRVVWVREKEKVTGAEIGLGFLHPTMTDHWQGLGSKLA